MIIAPMNPFLYCYAAPVPAGMTIGATSTNSPASVLPPYTGPGNDFANQMRAAMQRASDAHVLLVRDWNGAEFTNGAVRIVREAEQMALSALTIPVSDTAKDFARAGVALMEQSVATMTKSGSRFPTGAAEQLADGMSTLFKAIVVLIPKNPMP